MIPDVDEALRKLLLHETESKEDEVDIQFDQPRREWSSRLSKPTLNLFLFDLRENLRLRGSEQYTTINHPDGTAEVHRNPVRMDLRYLLTAWVKEAEDEHLLLASAMMGLLRNPYLPPYCLTERLKQQAAPIWLEVATFPPEAGPIDKLSEIWGVLDNEMRPGVVLTVTLALDPHLPVFYKQVRASEVRFLQRPNPELPGSGGAEAAALSKTYRMSGGRILAEKYDLSTLTVILVEKQMPVDLKEGGRFVLSDLPEGEYHLDIYYNKKVIKRQKISIPGSDLQIIV